MSARDGGRGREGEVGEGWRVGWAECYQCRYRWVAILEPGGSGDFLECPECEALDGWMVKYIDPPTARELLRWPDDDRDKYLRESARVAVRHGYPDDVF